MSEDNKNSEPSETANQVSKPADTDNEKSNARPSRKNETHHKKRATKHTSHAWGLISVILLAVLAAGGWYGYQLYQQTSQGLNELQSSQAALQQQNREYENQLNNRLAQVQNEQQKLTDYIDVLRQRDQHLRKDWLLLESEYLIQLANYRLLFERDINTAMAALKSADIRLRDTGDPGLVNVRKSIAEAIQALKQIPQADLAGLSLSLSAINKDIDKLPLKTPDPKSRASQQQQEMEQSKNVKSWSELPAAMWRDIKNLIVIRDHEAPIQPLLSPEERFFLIENLRLQIEQARLAMLSGQAKVYKERLTTAINWINEHFDRELPITVATLDTLNKLANESIAPELPDIAYTYQALQKYRLGQQANPPAVKSEKPASKKPEPEGSTAPAQGKTGS